MTNTISFMSANYVARQVGYNMTQGWGEGDVATQAYFRPLETYAERFETILQDITALGFSSMDLWGAHLHPTWATDEHIKIASDLLKKHNLTVASLAGWWDNLDDLKNSCKIAVGVGTQVLGGGGSLVVNDRPGMAQALRANGLKYGLENHPEKTPDEILAKIGQDYNDVIGVAIDTGWFGIQGYDAAKATEELIDRVFHIHLKDVLTEGEHKTCRFGAGIVPLEGCVRLLQQHGYTGAYSVEHEPETFDPTEDVKESFAMLRSWLS
jgi:L-ribulose-5-phosphate 3-epimerase